jgi:hypothetical protein
MPSQDDMKPSEDINAGFVVVMIGAALVIFLIGLALGLALGEVRNSYL